MSDAPSTQHEPVNTTGNGQEQEMQPVSNSNVTPSNRKRFFGSATSGASGMSLAVSWNDIKYSVKEGDKTKEILKGLNGCALPGRTLAIMGSSGAGKTTFLNALSDRLRVDKSHLLDGQMYLNDVPYHHKYRKLLAFVTQDDVVSSMATPTDAFSFSLRIRRGTDAEKTKERVDAMLEELNLVAAKDTIVGIPGVVAGLSGGERKRCNIGVELISDPKVLLLDEPTSGLDSVTSERIVQVCKDLAAKGRTVIFTIHQPTADCVNLFEDLMLMCQGYCVYHGTMEASLDYFKNVGYPCPDTYTPTDFYMTLLQDENVGPKLIEAWKTHLEGGNISAHNLTSPSAANRVAGDDSSTQEPPSSGETKKYLDDYVANTGSSLGIQFTELSKRAFQNVGRNKMYIIMSIVQAIFFALVSGIIFVNLKDDVTGIQDRMGVIFMVAANRCFGGAMMMINTFPPEKAVFIREQQSGAYSPAIYFLTKTLAELPVQIIGVFLESTILYFLVGFVIDAGRFFHYVAIVFTTFQAATGLGMLISCAVPSFELASGLAPLCIVPMMLAGGLLGSVDRLRPAWIWLEKLSIVRYSFILLARNEFEGIDNIYCHADQFPDVNGTAFCLRQPSSGQEVLSNLGYTGVDHSYWLMWVCLIAWVVVLRVFCVLALNKIAQSKS